MRRESVSLYLISDSEEEQTAGDDERRYSVGGEEEEEEEEEEEDKILPALRQRQVPSSKNRPAAFFQAVIHSTVSCVVVETGGDEGCTFMQIRFHETATVERQSALRR
ncbi:hypothetical protein F2P81_021399 [Scophthalmus maximus]|uniref:Uncharacterized protein n=1 Tax=Scophthalmus maximus TaxID=52904 RepID=A0A6A4S5Q2_SCOMX|nr:hypothetical protein F2P81_021399 [Scophthalmus maximus]